MQALRKTWFISDLHLDPAHQEISNQFIKLLTLCDNSVDDIYILGDLFEIWIGDDDHSTFHAAMINQLKQAARHGTRIHFMHGNRDFLIGQQFLTQSGCHLMADEERISVYGTPVLLMHGDTLCTLDTAYLRARKFAHSKILQKLFLLLPISIRKNIAARARKASEKHTGNTEASIMDVTQSEVERVMLKHDVDYLIHGHTHRPAMHQFSSSDRDKSRIVLPAWHHGGSVLEWRDNNEKKFFDL